MMVEPELHLCRLQVWLVAATRETYLDEVCPLPSSGEEFWPPTPFLNIFISLQRLLASAELSLQELPREVVTVATD